MPLTHRVLVADDHTIFRDGLKVLLGELPNIDVVGEANDGREAVKFCREIKPDLIIMDVAMPGLSGIDATRQIVNECPGTKVIALSMHSRKSFVLEMFKAGASGYLLKDCAFSELTIALDRVMADKPYISPEISSVVLESLSASSSGVASSFEPLTAREKEVLQLLAEGRRTRDIAYLLSISVKTVQTHRRNIMEKLDIHNLADLIRYAVSKGLTSLDL